jgi:hypothetical protein
MASPNSTFTELVTTTLRAHPGVIFDNVSNNNALLNRIMKRQGKDILDGGYEIVRTLDYAENSTYQRFSGYDTLNVGASDVISAAKYDWVNAAVHVSSSGDELRQNAGKNQLINLAKAKVKNAKRTAANKMSVDLYSSGSLANQMGGLAHIIQNNGQGTVGGIDSAIYTIWRNKFKESAGTNATDATTIKPEMQALWLELNRGMDMPDLIVSTHDFYTLYWSSLTDLQRYSNDSAKSANAGFNMLKFNQADIVFDSNENFTVTGEKMYFLNTEYIELCVHRSANWSQMEEKTPVNQDAVIIPMIWSGQLTCSNRSLQGVYIDAA